jgi:hypothetical protein
MKLIYIYKFISIIFLIVCFTTNGNEEKAPEPGSPYSMISKLQTECELEALSIGTILADHYNSFDEYTEWDVRIHNDFLVQHLGFAGWIQTGTWQSNGMTAHKKHAPSIHKQGGWAGHEKISLSAYWALEDQWLYMMGDSTVRQVWAAFVSPFQNNAFERNAKEWSRENCERQYPKRKEHPSGGFFPDEGWGGKCGNNEVTCHLPGFGNDGTITFDWKHFPYEDYDEWIWGENGKWSSNATQRRPSVVVVQVGLHTCFHAANSRSSDSTINQTLIENHENDLPQMMKAIRTAIDRPLDDPNLETPKTTVIIMTAGRIGNQESDLDRCIWKFNRIATKEAHAHGFIVLEREEIERRLLFKSEHWKEYRSMKFELHLANPSAQIIATSLLSLISCLKKNLVGEESKFLEHQSASLSSFKAKDNSRLRN